MRTYKILILLGLCFGSISMFAQPGQDLPSEEVQVIKIFEAQLAKSDKIPLNPEMPPVDTATSRQAYEVPTQTFTVEYPAPRIRPISYKSDEEVPEVYNAYAKLGGGLPAAVYGEGSYNTLVKRNDKSQYDLGIDLLHHSANFSNDEVENQRFGLTKANGQGTYYFEDGYAVGANMGYTSNKVHYYGYNFDPFPSFSGLDPEAVEQIFNTFDLGGKIFNGVQTAGDINYSAGFDFYVLSDNFAADETGLDLKMKATKWIQEKHSFDLGLRTDFTWYNDTMEVSQDLHNFTLSPAFTYHADAFKLKVGGNLVSNNDEFDIFPDAEVVINVTGNELAVYAGVEGNLQKNTFRTMSTYNPYIHTRFMEDQLRNTKYFNVYGGVRGNFSFFEYTGQVGYKSTNDLALYDTRFVDDGDPIYDFEVRYADANIINISGSITATPIRGLALTGTLSQSIFDMNKAQELEPWHLPSLEANVQALYTTMDGKLKAKAQLYLQNGVEASEGRGLNRFSNLNSLHDLSIGAEYWVLEKFGIFLDVNNLLNNERQRWRFYPTYGLNVLGGITARF